MKAIQKQVFAVYANDGCQGYSIGLPLALYPFKAAAEASPECCNLGGYSNVTQVNLCCFEDACYIYKSTINNKDIIGGCGIGIPINAFKVEYIEKVSSIRYGDNNDKTKYITNESDLIKFLNQDNYRVILYKTILTRDEDKYFELKYANTFKVNPFTLSRELAVKHALSKLSDEEKKLLGV